VFSAMRMGVAFMVAGAVLIVLGALDLDVGRDDLLHTVATTLIVFGAVVLSVATEATDQAAD
jgi:hypothetical protein